MRHLRLLAATVAFGCVETTEPAPTLVQAGTAPSAPEPSVEGATRPRRRVDIDQLRANIERVTGGIRWTRPGDGTELVDRFEELQGTLGVPDYLDTTNEERQPTLLFEKFLSDAARDVCADLVQREAGLPEPQRSFLVGLSPLDSWATNPSAIEANVQRLLLLWHGRRVEPGSPQIHRWLSLYQGAEHIEGEPVRAWRAVCQALFLHPDFTSY